MTTVDIVARIAPAPVTIGGTSVAPGNRAVLDLPLTELAEGTVIRLPLVIINGARPGPRLYIGAAIHGDEVTGVSIISDVLNDIDPHTLSGCIIAGATRDFKMAHRLRVATEATVDDAASALTAMEAQDVRETSA